MATTTYLPASDADKVIWLNNFKTKIAIRASLLGFTPAEVTSIINDAAYFQYVVQLWDTHKQTMLALSQYKNQLRTSLQPLPVLPSVTIPAAVPVAVAAGIFKRFSTYVVRIKNSPNYTPTIGQEFNIIVPSSPIDPANWQPELKVTLDAGRPKLRWTKGDAEAMQLYVDRGDGNGFAPLDKVIPNVYIDITDLPPNVFGAAWTYKGKFMLNYQEVGLFSQPVTINVVKQ